MMKDMEGLHKAEIALEDLQVCLFKCLHLEISLIYYLNTLFIYLFICLLF